MLWGIGDSSKLTEDERKLLQELQRLGETGHIVGLTPDQTQVALAAIKFYAAVTATSGFLAGFKNVCVWVGGMVVMWWALRDTIVETIKKIAGGG